MPVEDDQGRVIFVYRPDFRVEEAVLLEVKAAGVCGSDVEQWRHNITYEVSVPYVMGHEFAGVVVELGSEVEGWDEGDEAVSETAAFVCGKCPHCRGGAYNLCPERKGFGAHADGAFTRYVRVPARVLHRKPAGVSWEGAALTEPACVAYNATIVKSDPRPGEPAVVIGPGPIGLFVVQVLEAAGATPIVLLGTAADERRLALGRQLGADVVVDAEETDPAALIEDMTQGLGVPLVIDAAGNSAALEHSLAMVAREGQITKIGWGPQPVGLSLDPLVAKAARLQGAFSHTWRTWEAVLAMLSAGLLDPAAMITHQMSIREWRSAYQAAERREAVKAVLKPE